MVNLQQFGFFGTPERDVENLKTSIIIPAFNSGPLLEKCLEGCVSQESGHSVEIIVVDDGSIEPVSDICSRFGVGYIRQRNAGPAAARNRGWRNSSGEIVFFTDADCVPEKDWVEKLVGIIRAEQADVAGGGYSCSGGTALGRLVHGEIEKRHRRIEGETDFLGSFNLAVTRRALEAIGGFNPEYKSASGEDNDLTYRLGKAGFKLIFDRTVKVDHRHHWNLFSYLKSQARHGFWRMKLYRDHPDMAGGDDYAGKRDFLQPPLAVICTVLCLSGFFIPAALIAAFLLVLCFSGDFTMTGLVFIRSFFRGFGMVAGAVWFGLGRKNTASGTGRSILFISSLTDRSGSAVRIRHLAEEFQKLGYHTVLMERAVDDGGVPKSSFSRILVGESPLLAWSILKSMLIFSLHLCRNRYDIIFCLKPLPNAAAAVWIFGKGSLRILDIDDMDYAYYANPFFRKILKAMTLFFRNRFGLVTYHNPAIVEHLRLENAYHLAQGVGGRFLEKDLPHAGLRGKFGIPENARLVVYSGSLGFTSGLGEILLSMAQVLKENGNLWFMIIGTGERAEQFVSQTEELGIGKRTVFTGYVPYEHMPEYLSCADIGLNFLPDVLSSRFRASLKVREYLASSLITLSDLRGDSGLFREFIIPFRQPEDLPEVFRNLDGIRLPDGRAFLQNHFSWERITRGFEKHISSLLENS